MSNKIKEILKDKEKFKEVVKISFAKVDKDNSGTIDAGELGNLMKQLAIELSIEEPSEKEIAVAFKALDTNKDGNITMDEFAVVVKQMLEFGAN